LYCIVLWENVICFIKIKKSDFLKHLTVYYVRGRRKSRIKKMRNTLNSWGGDLPILI